MSRYFFVRLETYCCNRYIPPKIISCSNTNVKHDILYVLDPIDILDIYYNIIMITFVLLLLFSTSCHHKRAIVGSFDKSSHFIWIAFLFPLENQFLKVREEKISSLLKLLTDTIPKMTEWHLQQQRSHLSLTWANLHNKHTDVCKLP